MEKVEIIGLNLLNFHKFRADAETRIDRIEKQLPKCFTTD